MSPTEYTCDLCGGVFEKARSDDEAEGEALQVFGVPNASTDPGMAVVCDDCFEIIMARSGRTS